MKTVRNNLPRPTTSFVGRESEGAAIRQLFVKTPFITLLGQPGIGKTRLALRIGADLLGSDFDGVWFIELATVRTPEHVPDVAAAVLGLAVDDEHAAVQRIADLLARQNVLLILDNCEHLRDAAGSLATELTQRCPGVRVLATSREALGAPGEHVYTVRPLAVADRSDAPAADALRSSPAVELFADRAGVMGGAFALTGDNVLDVARICRQLDGLALAIELTASHVRAAGVKSLAEQLRELFGIGAPRETTMKSVLDWLFAQLSPVERRMLARSTVLTGSWTVAAAHAVCGEPFEDEQTTAATLERLVEKSLIVRSDRADGRFRLLEPMRDFIVTLPGAKEAAALAAARHAQYFADLIGAADRAHYVQPLRFIVRDLLAELDNIRAAITWAFTDRNDVELGCRMIGELGFAFRIIAYGEGVRLTRAAIAEADGPNAARISAQTRARLQRAYAEIEIRLHPEVLALALASVASYDALGQDLMAAESRRVYGFLLHRHGRVDEAIRELSLATVIFALRGERRSEGRALADLAVPVWMTGARDDAQSLFDRAVAAATGEGDRRESARMGLNFAECQFHTGALDAAMRTASDALGRCEGADLQEILASNLAAYALLKRDTVEARKYALLCLHLCRELASSVIRPIAHIAGVAALAGAHGDARALRLLGFADEQLRAANEVRDRTEQVAYDFTWALLSERTARAERTELLAAGARMTQAEAIDEALAV